MEQQKKKREKSVDLVGKMSLCETNPSIDFEFQLMALLSFRFQRKSKLFIYILLISADFFLHSSAFFPHVYRLEALQARFFLPFQAFETFGQFFFAFLIKIVQMIRVGQQEIVDLYRISFQLFH